MPFTCKSIGEWSRSVRPQRLSFTLIHSQKHKRVTPLLHWLSSVRGLAPPVSSDWSCRIFRKLRAKCGGKRKELTYSRDSWFCLRIRAFFLLTSMNHSCIMASSSSLLLPVKKQTNISASHTQHRVEPLPPSTPAPLWCMAEALLPATADAERTGTTPHLELGFDHRFLLQEQMFQIQQTL